ncbi:peptidyl-tRNA hydrolase [Aerococcus urinaehominis]|uniref:Peptidyl-tRNA hydrolase n=1 Tax=Aerococcus urinaehominis TaxID=128944 RepID=A0A109RGS5_9LACT|nr:aminoacyl-tRNA hydrolase [Aerococcus urinaehominis]AMB99171.1 peptidyl-tRNA hydrolase [Aerococcus urinaehominis]SDM06185.1 peptidyl-tRNA hydrolase, PTH1 family [Aerococcus urinaehominis]
MKIIVGLGNPGDKYQKTRHNIGFITLDEWAYQNHERFNQNKMRGHFFETHVNGEKVIFLKPQTFMNLSGECVADFMNYYKLSVDDLLVIYDDLDLPVGQVRLRKKGSAGGHNGMKNIIHHLATDQIKRIKIGIGRPRDFQTVVSYVLGAFPDQDHTEMLASVRQSCQAVDAWLGGQSFENVMNQYN